MGVFRMRDPIWYLRFGRTFYQKREDLMECFFCKKNTSKEDLKDVLPIRVEGKVFYCHTKHPGVKEEYEKQTTGIEK
jgi:hypothetical protein